MPAYVAALDREIQGIGRSIRKTPRLIIHTIYFGGGTPSLLPDESLQAILDAIHQSFSILPNAEITLEANPGTLNGNYLQRLQILGFNRLSLGVQSVHPKELELLGRGHGFEDVIEGLYLARRVGFSNINFDLIYGIPGQDLESWQQSLEHCLALGPDHLSLYALSLHEGTPLEHWVSRGLLPAPDPDLAADMYECASACLEQAGFVQYEISNWARTDREIESGHCAEQPAFACRHNMQYWRNRPYLGFGAGAHGYAEAWRYSNECSPSRYIERMQNRDAVSFPLSPAVVMKEQIDRKREIEDTMMLGLRLVQEGIRRDAFRQRFGASLEDEFGAKLSRLANLDLIIVDHQGIRLTRHGRLLGNQVFLEFI